jgi:hypothetical protein
MATKHVNADKGPEFQRSKGRLNGEKPKASGSAAALGGRERNVSHKKSEEHNLMSLTPRS